MKRSWILFVVSIFIFGSSVYAGGNLVKKVFFSPYPIILNGEQYASEMPILSYQDRTYVALREFSEMIDVDIDFVDDTIIINSEKGITNDKEKEDVINDLHDNTVDDSDAKKENLLEVKGSETNLVQEKTTLVYITSSGSKYHKNANCSNGKYYTSTLENASKAGYTACAKCAK